MQNTFRKYTEYNNHWGELWTFWLQVEGNTAALEQLATLLNPGPVELFNYQLHRKILPEKYVDIFVEHGGLGYMPYHNKCTGQLILPSDGLAKYDLHKGYIRWYFKECT